MTEKLLLCHSPGACSDVCIVALEEAGLDYELRLVDLARGEQNGAAYLSLVPLGKVPALQTSQGLVSENAAILTYLHGLAPGSRLFPDASTPMAAARRQTGLSFCGGNLHPIVRGLMNPARLTETDAEGVRAMARTLAAKSFGYAERLMAEQGWWLGEWSLVDSYLGWALSVARKAGFDLSPYPALDGLHAKLAERASYDRLRAVNAHAAQALAARA